MIKELQPTPAMVAALTRATGASVDTSKISIFECAALNTLPVSKAGSIFNGATISRGTFADMAAYLQAGNLVKLHSLHNQECGLPIGNVFMGDVRNDELRSLFYIGNDTTEGQDYIKKLNNSTIDQVSVGLLTKHARCSECGWDYFGPGASLQNFLDRTCANGHTIGEGGVHLQLDGMNKWYELSLVSVGAAQGAKIVGRAQSLLGKDEFQRLAASGFDPEITSLFTTVHQRKGNGGMAENTPPGNPDHSAGVALNLVATLSGEKAVLSTQLSAAQLQVTELTTKLSASEAKITELTAQLTAAAEAAKAADDLKLLLSFLSEQTKAALIASGTANPVVPETASGMIEAIKAAKLSLHNLPEGQQADSAAQTEAPNLAYLSAFKHRR